MFRTIQGRSPRLSMLVAAIATAGALAAGAASPARAQGPTFQTFGLSGNSAEPVQAEGYQGSVAVTCEANPAQRASGSFSTIGSATSGLSAQLSCKGAYRVEGQVWKDAGAKVTCTPFRYADPSDTAMNTAMFKSVKADGANVSCAMTASH